MKFHKNYQLSAKINSQMCLMLSVYKSFHQKVKYGLPKKPYITRFNWVEIEFLCRSVKTALAVSNRVSTTKNRFTNKTYINIPNIKVSNLEVDNLKISNVMVNNLKISNLNLKV